MARSDPNSPEPSGRMHDRGKARHSSGSGLEEEDRTIHSGHFMLSRVHDGESENEDDSLGFSPDNRGFDFFEATKSPPKTYSFGARSTQTLAIDASLTKLFQCMTLAYSGKITSPKWKPFKGMPLSLKDKVRLNNIIWREWPMQYIYGRKSVVCQFATPVSDDVHTKPEAVVLEGKYWKRRLDTVTAEYKKWRKYYKERVLFNPPEVSITEQNIVSHNDLLDRLREVNQALPRPQTGQVDMNLLSDEDFIMDFSDTLFTTLNQPFAFPNPRELSQSGYADIIQPGLMQLQPNLDDLCMDTFEPLQEMFNLRQQQATGPALFTASSRSNQLDTSSFLGQGDSSITSNLNLPMELLNNLGNSASGSLQQQQNQALMNAALSSLATQMQLPNFNFSSSQFSPSQSMDLSPSLPPTDTQMIVDAPDPQSQFSPVPQTQNVATHNHQKTRNSSLTKGTNSRIKSMNTQSNFPSQGKPRLAQSANKQSGQHSVHNKPSSAQSKKMSHSAAKSVSAGKPTFSGDSTEKKEVNFAVPKGKPVSSRMKQRAIAPAPALQASPPNVNAAPSSNVAQKNTYLAQLLTTDPAAVSANRQDRVVGDGPVPAPACLPDGWDLMHRCTRYRPGNYPGAVIKVKNEPQGSLPQCVSATSPAVPPFRPLTTSPSTSVAMQTPIAVCQPIVPAPSGLALVTNVGDFPASVLIAAASQALGTNTASVKDAVSIAHTTRLTGKIASTIPTPAPSLAHSLLSTSAMPSSPSSLPSHGSPASVSSPPPPDFSMASSPSPSKTSVLPKSENSSPPHREERKRSHISAEQKRRGNIKSGFDVIHAIIPSLSQNPNAKVSKAAMLQKTAEYCKKLKSERTQMQNEAEILKQEIESLNSAINTCQLQLPATGVPITRQRADKMRELFDDYVKNRTLLNWKFWIFSSIIRCLFESYNSMVSTVSLDELCRTVLAWLDQHCSLVSLRPTVLNSLRHLSTTTSILSDPSKVPDQVTQAVTRQNQPKPPGDT